MANTLDFILSVDTADGRSQMQKFRQTLNETGDSAAAMSNRASQAMVGLSDTLKKMNADWHQTAGQIQNTRLTSMTDNAMADWDRLMKGNKKVGASFRELGEEAHIGIRDGMGEIRGFANLMGIQMPYVVEKFLAKMEGLQPIMSAAFNISAALGLFMILMELPKAYDRIVGAVTGWDDAAKKSYASFIQENRNAVDEAERLRRKLADIQAIGKSGSTASAVEQTNITAAVQRRTEANARLLGTQQLLLDLQQRRKDRSDPVAGAARDPEAFMNQHSKGPLYGPGMPSDEELEKQLRGLDEALNKGRIALSELQVDEKRATATMTATLVTESRSRTLAEIDAARNKSMALIGLREAQAKDKAALGNLSAEEELTTLQSLENDKYKALTTSFQRKETLARSMAATDAAASKTELATLHSEEQKAKTDHEHTLFDIGVQHRNKEMSETRASTQVGIDARLKLADAGATLLQSQAQDDLATGKITSLQGLAIFEKAENDKYAALVTSYHAREELATLMRTTDANASELALAQVHGEEEASEQQHRDRMLAIAVRSHAAQIQLINDRGLVNTAGTNRENARIAFEESQARNTLALGQISARQELAIEEKLETEKFQAAGRSLHARMDLAEQLRAVDAEAAKNQLVQLHGEEEVLEIGHQQRISEIRVKYLQRFRDELGRVWDTFFQSGATALQRLFGLAKDMLLSIGRSLFQSFGTALLTGRSGGAGGLAGAVGNLGAGVGVKLGLGSLLGSGTGGGTAAGGIGGGSLLAGVIGHGAALEAAPGSIGVLGAGGGLTGGATGATGALGLGGGAGLFGLGAATIPVLGGIALGVFGLYKLFHHGHAKVAVTNDPLGNLSRTLWFNSTFPFEKLTAAIADLNKTVGRVNNTMDGLETQPPGVLMVNNYAAIKSDVKATVSDGLATDRRFRRNVSGTILEQPI